MKIIMESKCFIVYKMPANVSLVFASNKYLICSTDFVRKRVQYNLSVKSHPRAYTVALTLPWFQLEIKPVIKH